jgi:hypothetical protein
MRAEGGCRQALAAAIGKPQVLKMSGAQSSLNIAKNDCSILGRSATMRDVGGSLRQRRRSVDWGVEP